MSDSSNDKICPVCKEPYYPESAPCITHLIAENERLTKRHDRLFRIIGEEMKDHRDMPVMLRLIVALEKG